jgi:hypothetical protein
MTSRASRVSPAPPQAGPAARAAASKARRRGLYAARDEALDLPRKGSPARTPPRVVFLTSRGMTRRTCGAGRAGPRHEQRRQLRAALPRAVVRGAQGGPRLGRVDVLLRGLDRQRSHRLLRRQHAQHPTRDHEISRRGEAEGHEGRRGEPAARGRPRPLLGAFGRGERALRHAAHGRVLRGPHGRRPGVPPRGFAARRRPRRGGRALRPGKDELLRSVDGLARRATHVRALPAVGLERSGDRAVRTFSRRLTAVFVWSMG